MKAITRSSLTVRPRRLSVVRALAGSTLVCLTMADLLLRRLRPSIAEAYILPNRPGVFCLLADSVQRPTAFLEEVPAPLFALSVLRSTNTQFSDLAENDSYNISAAL